MPEALQFKQEIAGKLAGPCTQLEDIALRLLDDLHYRFSQALREQWGYSGRRNEITSLTELFSAPAVITEPRRIKRQMHIACEIDPSTRPCDFVTDEFFQRSAVVQRFCAGKW